MLSKLLKTLRNRVKTKKKVASKKEVFSTRKVSKQQSQMYLPILFEGVCNLSYFTHVLTLNFKSKVRIPMQQRKCRIRCSQTLAYELSLLDFPFCVWNNISWLHMWKWLLLTLGIFKLKITHFSWSCFRQMMGRTSLLLYLLMWEDIASWPAGLPCASTRTVCSQPCSVDDTNWIKIETVGLGNISAKIHSHWGSAFALAIVSFDVCRHFVWIALLKSVIPI